MGFFSRLFGRSKKEENHEIHVEEQMNLDPYPSNKLVKFKDNGSQWSGKFAIILSREDKTESQLKEVYKKEIPFFYRIAVQNDHGKFMKLKLPVSHLKVDPVTPEELEQFKKNNNSIALVEAPVNINDNKELTTQDEVNRWNSLISSKSDDEEECTCDEKH